MILTDPFMRCLDDDQDGLLLKPFAESNRIRILQFPITAAVGCINLALFTSYLKLLEPKKVVCSESAHKLLAGNPDLDFPIEPSLVPGTSIDLQPSTLYSSYYTGKCPSQLAAEIQLTRVTGLQGVSQLSRLPDVALEMRDNKYHVQKAARPRMLDKLLAMGQSQKPKRSIITKAVSLEQLACDLQQLNEKELQNCCLVTQQAGCAVLQHHSWTISIRPSDLTQPDSSISLDAIPSGILPNDQRENMLSALVSIEELIKKNYGIV